MKSMNLSRFHHEIWWFQVKSDVSESAADVSSKNSSDFTRFGGGFHLKSAGFHEICQISPEIHQISWNLLDFIWISWKSGGFHDNPWNLADFTMKSGGFQVKSDVSEISCRCFSKNSSDFTRFGVDFTWNPPDFMKSAGFHTDFMKSGGFHEIRRISCEIERPLQGIVTLCLVILEAWTWYPGNNSLHMK